MKMNLKTFGAIVAAVSGIAASSSFAGIVQSGGALPNSAAGAFPAGYVISSPAAGDPTVTANQVNQQVNSNAALIQTFVPTSTFKIDKFVILSGGKGGGDIIVHIYPINVAVTGQGGGNADGFVNTQFSTDLLGGGAGVAAHMNGSGGTQLITFDLTDSDEVTLTAGVEYGIELATLATGTNQISWQRSGQDEYPSGNIYQVTGGNAPGNRFQVGGTPTRDALFAVYAVVPEPSSIGLLGAASLGLLHRRRQA